MSVKNKQSACRRYRRFVYFYNNINIFLGLRFVPHEFVQEFVAPRDGAQTFPNDWKESDVKPAGLTSKRIGQERLPSPLLRITLSHKTAG